MVYSKVALSRAHLVNPPGDELPKSDKVVRSDGEGIGVISGGQGSSTISQAVFLCSHFAPLIEGNDRGDGWKVVRQVEGDGGVR